MTTEMLRTKVSIKFRLLCVSQTSECLASPLLGVSYGAPPPGQTLDRREKRATPQTMLPSGNMIKDIVGRCTGLPSTQCRDGRKAVVGSGMAESVVTRTNQNSCLIRQWLLYKTMLENIRRQVILGHGIPWNRACQTHS